MLGLENLIGDYFGDNPGLYLIAGLGLLIVINLIVTIWLNIKNKTFKWEEVPAFIQPVVLYAIFILAMEVLIISAKGLPALHQMFTGLEVIGFAAILLKYFKQIISKLKQLGMPVDEQIDQVLENKIDSIVGTTRDQRFQRPVADERGMEDQNQGGAQG